MCRCFSAGSFGPLVSDASPEYQKVALRLKRKGHDVTQGDAIGVVVSDTLIDMYDHEGNITSIPLADISSYSLVSNNA